MKPLTLVELSTDVRQWGEYNEEELIKGGSAFRERLREVVVWLRALSKRRFCFPRYQLSKIMDEQNQNLNVSVPQAALPTPDGSGQAEAPQKSKFWKFAVWFVVIVIASGVGLWALGDYQGRKNVEEFERWAEDTRQAMEDLEAKKAADTYGGTTPQETLRMYIEAVERGDYELAGKYFVLGGQEVELESLTNSPPENIQTVTRLLKEAINNAGSYSTDRKEFAIEDPILVHFVLYPSGIWKIVKI